MRQVEALQIIADEKGLWLGMPTRGHYTVYSGIADKTIPPRVWERLLDLGDVDIQEGYGVGEKWLVVTDRGRARLEETNNGTS